MVNVFVGFHPDRVAGGPRLTVMIGMPSWPMVTV
jgi:hypothetical protein